ncbi:MAG: translation initiation factor IF-2 [Candidatus Omnitrophica bacterium]|jgi:translation initiation factor IF-2|nr:translation initiation factor IF-2 [Candidatus Omnitrophota bacterium]
MTKVKNAKTLTVKKATHAKAKVESKPKKTASKPAVKVKAEKPKAKPAPKKVNKPKVEGIKQAHVKPEAIKKVEAVKPELKVKVVTAAQIKPEIKVEQKPLSTPVVKPVVQPASAKTVVKPVVKPAVKSEQPTPVSIPQPPVASGKQIELDFPITIKDLGIKLQEKPSVLIKSLMGMGVMVGINQALDEATANKICQKFNCVIKKIPSAEEIVLAGHKETDLAGDLKPRRPVVTLMGHVDHGKTSLLDAIRKTKVVDDEHGGITQHIGAYRVSLPQGEIAFLDTPGHEAFTAMRARGASITDIVILVVAADDGIMPQTQEAIDHARAAGVPIIVAINKIDKPQANLDMVKKQLTQAGLSPEDWGGKTITVPVSAKTGVGIDNLLEMVLLQAEVMELKANPKRPASGVVVEARMSKGRGPVATLLVQNGTLHLNQNIIAGNLFGKVRAMVNDRGQAVTSAGPATPVEVLGISGIPEAGDRFFAVEDEKQAKLIAESRQEKDKVQQLKSSKRISLEDLYAQINAGKIKELKIILKADVQGSLEAIKDTLDKLNVSEIKLDIIHAGVGNINNSDVILAVASDALILGFNVVSDDLAKELIAKEGVDVKTYNIIYELANDIKAAVEGMLEPKLKRIFLGRAEVRKMFKLSRSGTIAGCFVTKGKIIRNSSVSLVRNGQVAFEGTLSSLKRFKDDVREVAEGFECGLSIAGFEQLAEGDIIEAYGIEKIARTL